MKQLKTTMVVSLALVLVAGSVLADNINGVEISFENIGNAGNAADSTGYGAVGYDYRIGTTEISFDQFSPSGLASDGSGDNPAVNMTWHVAAQYANWLTSSNINNGAYAISGGKVTAIDRAAAIAAYGTVYVLPTEDEWYKAAYFTGSGYSSFANGTGTAPVAGTDANYINSGGGPWNVGGGTVEQNGTFDMMGNVWEWLESTAGGEAFDPLNDDQNMVVRGGAYHLPDDYYLNKANRVAFAQRGVTDVDAGIRIVAIPEPGTISLMSLSTLSLFFTRTVRRRKQAGKSLLPIRREYSCDTFEGQDLVYDEGDGTDPLEELKQVTKAYLLATWSEVHSRYMVFDKLFWNRMVAMHERRLARRKAFRVAFKKRALDGLDAFLALIMK